MERVQKPAGRCVNSLFWLLLLVQFFSVLLLLLFLHLFQWAIWCTEICEVFTVYLHTHQEITTSCAPNADQFAQHGWLSHGNLTGLFFFKWLAHNLNPLPSVHPVLLLTPCWSQALDLPTLLRCDIVNEGLLSPLVVFLFIFLLWGLTLGS